MAEIKCSCPHCGQHITCDELWGGHQLQCPKCQGTLTVPAIPGAPAVAEAPAASSAPAAASSLVPKPPQSAAPKLALDRPQSHGEGAASAPPRNIPIRNLAAPPPRKKNPVVTYVVAGVVVVAALVAGIFFGYPMLKGNQDKADAKSQEQAKGAQANQQNPNGAGQEAQPAAAAEPAPPPQPDPPIWNMDLATAKIPEGRVNGTISGSNFVAEIARIDPVGTAQVLRLIQGQLLSPDREILVYLHPKAAEKLSGQTLAISSEMKGAGVPQVSKLWKTDPKHAPTQKNYFYGYTMKLELGPMTNDLIRGKIFLSLPDTEQSVVAGVFSVTNGVVDPNQQPVQVMTPAAAPAMDPAARANFNSRYGIRR